MRVWLIRISLEKFDDFIREIVIYEKTNIACDLFIVPEPPFQLFQFFDRFAGKTAPQNTRRDATNDRIGLDVFGDDSASTNHRAISNRNPGHQHGTATDPNIVTD